MPHATKSNVLLTRVFDIDTNGSLKDSVWPSIDTGAFHVEYCDARLIEAGVQMVESCDLAILRFVKGFDLCKECIAAIRKAGVKTPILVLSGSSQPRLATGLLDVGADDYITADTDVDLLTSRMRAGVRKARYPVKVTGGGDDPPAAAARYFNSGIFAPITLTRREAMLLSALSERPGHWMSKSKLEEILWPGRLVRSNIVESVICGLRRKLVPQAIIYERQLGYCVNTKANGAGDA